MRQPKYKFGDSFTKEVNSEYEGVRTKVSVTHFITSISCRSEAGGFDYYYFLSSSVPAAYNAPSWTSDAIIESKLDKLYDTKQKT